MFLDDELIKIVEEAVITDAASIQELNKKLCKKCESYYMEKMRANPRLTNKEIKVILDRTFNLWDSFARQLLKKEGAIQILGKLFTEHSFKKQWLTNDAIREIYETL